MQKVVGSSPIIRFGKAPLRRGFLVFERSVLPLKGRRVIEGVFSSLKEQMRLERHHARTPAGLAVRTAQRILGLTLGMLLDTLAGRRALAGR
jgi:hypothetical protein